MTASSPDNVAYLKCKIEELTKELSQARGELTEAHEYQTATGDILNLISRSPSQLQPVLDAMLQTAGRLCEAGLALFFKLQDGRYHLAGSNNAEAAHVKYLSQHPIDLDRGSLVGRTALERRPVHLPDCLADPAYTRRDEQRIGNYRSMLGVPLLRDGVAIGVIGLLRTIVKPFTARQIELVATFADQAVIAIENARLFEELQARTRDVTEALEYQTATSEVLQVISSSPTDAQPVFDTIAKSVARLCKAQFCHVFRFDGELVHFAAEHGLAPEAVEAIRRAYPIAPGRTSAAARSILSGAVEEIPDVLADRDYAHGSVAKTTNFRSIAAVPMLKAGRPIGAIAIARSQTGHFPERQIELLRTFADQAVIAIENARLFDDVQARTRELSESLGQQTATSEILRVISSSPTELQPVLDELVKCAARFCGADDAVIHRLEGDSLPVVAHHGMILAPIGFVAPAVRGTITGRCVLERRAIHVADYQAETEEFPEGSAIARELGYRTILSVPLLREGAPLGAIILRRTEVEPFSASSWSRTSTPNRSTSIGWCKRSAISPAHKWRTGRRQIAGR